MALVKMTRAVPEVKGGKTEALVPEDAVSAAMSKGWRVAEKTSEKTEQPKEPAKKSEPAFDKPKAEEPKAEVKAEKKEEVVKSTKK